MFTLCIATMDRFDNFLYKYLPDYLNIELIDEIIITDENGNDANKIQAAFPNNSKIKLFVNDKCLGPFLNKIKACSLAQNEWIVLIDSDNFAPSNYFYNAADYIISNNVKDQKNVILAPCFARPRFNFYHLNGFIYEKGSFQSNNVIENQLITENNMNSEVLMNTGNYVLNKYLIENLDLSQERNKIFSSSACDVIYFNTLLFEQLDLKLHVVATMEYDHVVHDGSIFVQTHIQNSNFIDEVHQRYRNLE
jgi:hypothetical protein